jgi:phosphoribosylglycinamide formyltransferase 1
VITRDLRFAFVLSTAGSVMNEVLKVDFVRSRVQLVVVDREGVASEHARRHGLEPVVIPEEDVAHFGDRLASLLAEHAIDFVFSYYTSFYPEALRSAYRDRLVNFHPSLLPAFKGGDAFERTISYPARFAGNTVEFIADVMDEGKIIMQTACPVDDGVPLEDTRHRVFVQQCQALIQVAQWLQDGRVVVDGRRVTVVGASFDDAAFSPALDSDDALGAARIGA